MDEDASRDGEPADGPSGSGFSWSLCCGAFQRYKRPQSSADTSQKSSTLQVVKRSIVGRLTKEIIDTYQLCNPNFTYSEAMNPKRFLTNPSAGVLNDGFDNANSDLILHVNFVLVNLESKKRYIVKDVLGQGTFGQVAKCLVSETNSFVAVKIIKNQPAYYHQALVEVTLLQTLNKSDPDDKHHIVRIHDYFVFQRHLCIIFEMLGSNLYELIKMNHFKGLSLNIVQMFARQILDALIIMKDASIIHCDLKPENILISTSVKPAEIKVIDFGSACMEGQTVYSYIQSRYYRSPEVLLGYPYTTAIDMWSFGCIVVELFLGLPLFPGASEYDLLKRMIEILGAQPPDYLLRDAKNTSKFFKHVGSIYRMEDDKACMGSPGVYRVLTEEEYELRESKKPVLGKRYFNYVKLEDIVANYPYRKNLPEEEISKENLTRLALVDFLRGLLQFDPVKRWSPWQASRHPFVTGELFSCPYKPPLETPRIPVHNNVTVYHNPIGGHWLAAGLSPQVASLNRCIPNNSLHIQMTPFSYGSYGSMGSHGSYNENLGLGSSYGSYGDVNSIYMYHQQQGPPGLTTRAQVGGSLLGASPDARRQPQLSHGSGFVVSPSTGSFMPMSIGASPSQFTPPSSQMQIASASPGKFGPSSPARGFVHGSPLGKAAAVGQYHRRRNWGNPGTSPMQLQDTSLGWQCHQIDGHGSSRNMFTDSSCSSWKQHRGSGHPLSSGSSLNNYQNLTASYSSIHPPEMLFDKPESSSPPDPADWDPNYSDDLLLQEDLSDISFLSVGVANSLRLATEAATSTSGVYHSYQGHNKAHIATNFSSSGQRFQAGSFTDSSTNFSPYNCTGYGRSPHFSHNSPSRFGQKPAQGRKSNHVRPTYTENDRGHQKSQQSPSNFSMTGPHPPASSLLGDGFSWGRRAGHPIATTLPSSHMRKDYERIS